MLILSYCIVVQDYVHENLQSLTSKFTCDMEQWKLEWETLYWWKFETAGVLFVAAAFGHASVVKWLLEKGADRKLKCFVGQTATEFIGECCFGEDHKDDIDECKALLMESPRVPSKLTDFKYEQVIGMEQVSRKATQESIDEEGKAVYTEIVLQELVQMSTVKVYWSTPSSNGSLVEEYDLKYAIGNPNTSQGTVAAGGSKKGWIFTSTKHARGTNEQTITMTKLQLNQHYQVLVRARNIAGYAEWSDILWIHTAQGKP